MDLYPLPPPDLTRVLEEHLAATFPPELAIDLVLNELVVRAADATRASTASLALSQGEEMVCRAATGAHAPGLGVPLNMEDGLSGACVRTYMPQLCDDAESDPRVDSAVLSRLGIRSMLIVPIFDEPPEDRIHEVRGIVQRRLVGIIEVLSPVPSAFSDASQRILEEFASEAARVRRAGSRLLLDHAPASAPSEPELLHSFDSVPNQVPVVTPPHPQPYETWSLIMSGLVIVAAIGVSFMVGSRVGWINSRAPVSVPAPAAAVVAPTAPPEAATAAQTAAPADESAKPPRAKAKTKPPAASDNPPPASAGDLVVYDKGKVIFRLKTPAPGSTSGEIAAQHLAHDEAAQAGSPVVPAASNARIALEHRVRLAPEDAQARLLSRRDPQYPPDALAAHRSGNVVLDISVAEDGSVSAVHALSGDPQLAAAAAEAVRTWRYQPYRANEQPAAFRTSVTVSFSPPQ